MAAARGGAVGNSHGQADPSDRDGRATGGQMTTNACVSRWLGALAAFLIVGLPGPARAQETGATGGGTDRPTSCAFGAAAQSHAQAGRRLAVSRGFTLPSPGASDPIPSETEIIGWLGERISDGTYPNGTHVLFYSRRGDRKSTRLNSSHSQISYAVFCLKKKK